MKTFLVALFSVLFVAALPARAATLSPGLYRNAAGESMYVGTENESPDPAVAQYFAPATRRTGELSAATGLTLQRGVNEKRFTVRAPEGPLGVSLWSAGEGKRAVVILIHGNDPETRDMGYIIPYFVLSGINVVSYDQRGTGDSSGNWFLNGPAQRAVDVEAIFDAIQADPHVDAKRIGVWGFSNGGWTAPIVATTRPVAFMILKSAPAESLDENIAYEVTQRMQRDRFDAASIASAQHLWRTMIGALRGTSSWEAAKTEYNAAAKTPWFGASLMLPNLKFPLSATFADGLRRFVTYDPAATLPHVQTPTLALFGALDRNVDAAHAAATFKTDFARAGMRDFTERVFSDAGHTLVVSKTGYNNQPTLPERLSAGYPDVTTEWLNQRGFLSESHPLR